MQSQARRMKRIMAGLQNPMPNSTKIAHSSMNNYAVNRTHKFGKKPAKAEVKVEAPKKTTFAQKIKNLVS